MRFTLALFEVLPFSFYLALTVVSSLCLSITNSFLRQHFTLNLSEMPILMLSNMLLCTLESSKVQGEEFARPEPKWKKHDFGIFTLTLSFVNVHWLFPPFNYAKCSPHFRDC